MTDDIILDIISECSICWEYITNDDLISLNCCSQKYHKTCFLEWISSRKDNIKCTICHKSFNRQLKNFINEQEFIELIRKNKSKYKFNEFISIIQEKEYNIKQPHKNNQNCITLIYSILGLIFLSIILMIIVFLISNSTRD